MTPPSDRRVLLIGAGGHARVCLEALQDMAQTVVVGAVSRDGRGIRELGVPVIGRDEEFGEVAQREGVTTFCVAVGDNSHRKKLCHMVTESGAELTSAISRAATVSRTAQVGAGSHLLAGSVVNAASQVGVGVIVNTNASVDHDCRIGDFVHIAPGVAIGGDVTIGAGALVGIGSRVLSGLTIGAGATVAGGAVVVQDVPPGVTVVGAPARRADRDTAVS